MLNRIIKGLLPLFFVVGMIFLVRGSILYYFLAPKLIQCLNTLDGYK